MERLCNSFGLEMHQKFNVSGRYGRETAYAADNPYFFTQTGIFDEYGKPHPDMLMPLIEGTISAEPLAEYRYLYADTVDPGKMAGQEVKAVAAFFEGEGESKTLCAVITPDSPRVVWCVERREKGKEPVSIECAGFTDAAEVYSDVSPCACPPHE